MSNEHLYCVWCGSKGGFANQLIIHRTGVDAIIECEWCSMGDNLRSSKRGQFIEKGEKSE